MKHVSRLIILMSMLLFLVTLPTLANEVQVIDFAQAEELTLLNNLDLKIAALTLANSQIDLEKNQLKGDADTRIQQLTLSLDLLKSQDSYQETRYNILLSLITDYTELTKKRQTIEVNEIILQTNELDLKLTKDLYTKGNATSIDLKKAENTVEEQKLTLQKSKDDYTKLIDSLKQKIGLSGEVQFVELVLNIDSTPFDLTKVLEEAFNNSYDLKDKEVRHQLAILEVEKGDLEKKPELEMKKLENNQEIAWYRYLQATDDLTQKIKDHLWELEQISKTLEVKKINLEIAKENYQQMLTGYQKGYYTENQFLQSKSTLFNAEKTFYSAKVDYMLKFVQLQYQMGKDIANGGELK